MPTSRFSPGAIASSSRRFIGGHKVISAVAILALVAAGYYGYSKLTSTAGVTRYVLAQVAPQTIISSISASGQVAAVDQIDAKARVSARITSVLIKAGDKVASGQPIAYLDSSDAQSAITRAEQSLITAKLQYQRDSAAAPIDFQKAQDTLDQDKQDLEDSYIDTFNVLSTAYLDIPPVMTAVQEALYGYTLSANRSQWNSDIMVNYFSNTDDRTQAQRFADTARADYQSARTALDKALTTYKTVSRTSSPQALESLLLESTTLSTLVAQAVQSELNFLNTVNDLAQRANVQTPAYFTSLISTARSNMSTANSSQSSLINQKKTITNNKLAIKTDEQNLALLRVGNAQGTDPISLQVTAANIAADERSLAQLKADLADYVVRAPFTGTVASVSANVGDTGGTIASIITKTQVAELSVNEIDAAKIKPGQKATLSFDAIDGFALAGSVASIDPVGAVSQGVVSYTIKVAFATQDARVKPGMTVNASIILTSKPDVLALPAGAIKTATNGDRYVLLVATPPTDPLAPTGVELGVPAVQTTITTGITDDTTVEVLTGLTDGQYVVLRTVSAAAAQQAGNLFSALGARPPSTGAARTGTARPGN